MKVLGVCIIIFIIIVTISSQNPITQMCSQIQNFWILDTLINFSAIICLQQITLSGIKQS